MTPQELAERVREAFEVWIKRPPFERNVERFSNNPAESGWPGQYRSYSTQLAWCAWQAALDLSPLYAEQGAGDEPRITLSCGCRSHHFGFPAQWQSQDKEGDDCTIYGSVCEKHFYEYEAKPAQYYPAIAQPKAVSWSKDCLWPNCFCAIKCDEWAPIAPAAQPKAILDTSVYDETDQMEPDIVLMLRTVYTQEYPGGMRGPSPKELMAKAADTIDALRAQSATAPTAGGLPEEPPNIEFLAENIPVGESRTIRLEMPEPVVKRSDYNKLRTAAEALQAENERMATLLRKNEGRVKEIVDEHLLTRTERAEQSAAQLREQLAAAMEFIEKIEQFTNGYGDIAEIVYRQCRDFLREQEATSIQAAERGEKEP